MNPQRLADKPVLHRSALALLLALTLVMRVLVPAGTMPVQTADRSIIISLCTGQGALATQIRLNADDEDHNNPSGGANLCPYALADAGAPPLAGPAGFALPDLTPPATDPHWQQPAPTEVSVHLRPPPRAPPQLG